MKGISQKLRYISEKCSFDTDFLMKKSCGQFAIIGILLLVFVSLALMITALIALPIVMTVAQWAWLLIPVAIVLIVSMFFKDPLWLGVIFIVLLIISMVGGGIV